MAKKYPKDTFGIQHIGIEKWLRDYYIPVTGQEYNKIFTNVFFCYEESIKQFPKDSLIYWISVSFYHLPTFAAIYIMSLLRMKRLIENGYTHLCSYENEKISNDATKINFYDIGHYNTLNSAIFSNNAIKNFINLVRAAKQNLNTKGVVNRNFFKNLSHPSFLVGYRFQREVVHYCQENRVSPIQLPPMLFANNNPTKNVTAASIVTINSFVQMFFSKTKEWYPIIDNANLDLIMNNVSQIFQYGLGYFLQLASMFKMSKNYTLIATALGGTVHRLFCAAWRYAGGEVVGFLHGNTYCNCYVPGMIKELSTVSNFVAYSPSHAMILQDFIKNNSTPFRLAEITSFKQSYYRNLFEELQNKTKVKRIKKIMLIGFPMGDFYYYNHNFSEHHVFSHLELELQLVKILKRNKYYVIYKAHPSNIEQVKWIFDEYVDEVNYNPFEKVYNTADCMLFKESNSTPFGFSLLTNRPIVLININGNSWHPTVYDLLPKRCRIVDAVPRDGKITFDEKELLCAIESSIDNINYDVVHQFAL